MSWPKWARRGPMEMAACAVIALITRSLPRRHRLSLASKRAALTIAVGPPSQPAPPRAATHSEGGHCGCGATPYHPADFPRDTP